MAEFAKKTWQCDDVITADDLNRLEGGVEEALECCGSADVGYECTETVGEPLFDSSLTTVLDGNYAYADTGIHPDADKLAVTVDGTRYVCPRRYDNSYGAPYDVATNDFDWTDYPFNIGHYGSFSTQTAGTWQVKIESIDISVTTTPCFKRAVQQTTEIVYFDVDNNTLSHTYEQIASAIDAGKKVYAIALNSNTDYYPASISPLRSDGSTFWASVLVHNTYSSRLEVHHFELSASRLDVTSKYVSLTNL